MSHRAEDKVVAKRGNGRRIGWFLFHTTNVICIASLAVWGRWLHVNQLPESAVPQIPTVTLPTENAFTKLGAIGAKVVQSKDVSYAMGRQNKRTLPDHVYTLQEREQLIAANRSVLMEARQALTLPGRAIPLRDFKQTFPELAQMRNLARLFSLDGYVAEDEGQYGRAANAYLDAMALGNKASKGGCLIPKLVAIACGAIGRRPLVSVVDKLNATEARQVASRLEGILAEQTPLTETFREEKYASQASLTTAFREGSIDEALNTWQSMESNSEEEEKPTLAKRWEKMMQRGQMFAASLQTSKATILRDNARYYDRLIAQMALPYDPKRPPITEPKDIINQVLLPVFVQARHKDDDDRMTNALLLTKLALQAYRQEHNGAVPETLDSLVKEHILTHVPSDPYGPTLTTPLRYTVTGQGTYRLYSIGPDGRDDDGNPIVNKHDDGRPKMWTESTSKGDFVLGTNLY